MKTNFFCKFLLSLALLTHVSVIFSMQECKLCKKNFSYNQRTYFDHLIKKHLQCPWCDIKPFLSKISLLKHVEVYHSSVKIYCCINCQFITVRPYETRRHMGLTAHRRTEKCFFEVTNFINKILPNVHRNYCYYCKQYFEKINNHFLYNHDIWLYGLSDIINKVPSHNTLKPDLETLNQDLLRPTDNNNNLEENTCTLYEFEEILNSNSINANTIECPNCRLIFQNLDSYFEHMDECLLS